MKKIVLQLFKLFMNFIYIFIKLFKTKHKVTFLSRQSNDITLDFKFLITQLKEKDKDIEIVTLCKKFDNLKKHFIKYALYTLKSMYHIATSKVCVIDSYCLPISILKHKKNLKVLQIWHALGAIKKFGYQSVGKKSGRSNTVASALNMHKNYDLIISGSKEMTKYFAKAFGYQKDKFLNCGLPRIDYLIKNEKTLKEEIFDVYPKLKEKINILYAPTFRTTKDDATIDLIKNINLDKYNLIIKSHMNQKMNYDDKNIFTCDKYSSLDLLTICDYLITDYSAIAIEGAILDKKTYYYVFDYEKYKENNGLNIDLYKEMPGCVFDKAQDLALNLEKNNYDLQLIKKYKNKYITNQKGNSTEIIVDKILNWLKEK